MKLPIVLARCCRDWQMPAPYWAPWGRCGLCKQVPEFVESIPEEEWPDDSSRQRSPAGRVP